MFTSFYYSWFFMILFSRRHKNEFLLFLTFLGCVSNLFQNTFWNDACNKKPGGFFCPALAIVFESTRFAKNNVGQNPIISLGHILFCQFGFLKKTARSSQDCTLWPIRIELYDLITSMLFYFFSYRENKLATNRFLLKNKEFVVLSLSICTMEKLYPSIVSFLCFSLRDLLNFCRFYKSPIIAHSYAHSWPCMTTVVEYVIK